MDKANSKKKLIVLVEDEKIMVNLLTRKLEDAGYAVKVAGDGLPALLGLKKPNPTLCF